mmetsp:Transcript_4169/g.13551  ORF Transcript_4169/g.13551 Transcript_4169/m.13551 type:complete len:210 (-) Transcript_4169:725-1354(-)
MPSLTLVLAWVRLPSFVCCLAAHCSPENDSRSDGEDGDTDAVDPFFVFFLCRRRLVEEDEDESDRCVGTGDDEVDEAIDVDCEPLGEVAAPVAGDAALNESVDSSASDDRRSVPLPATSLPAVDAWSDEDTTDVRRTRRCALEVPPAGVEGVEGVVGGVVDVGTGVAPASAAASSAARERRIASSIIICSTAAADSIARLPGASGDEPK